jgi:hypothetical protein
MSWRWTQSSRTSLRRPNFADNAARLAVIDFFKVGLALAPHDAGTLNASPINALRLRVIGGSRSGNSQTSAKYQPNATEAWKCLRSQEKTSRQGPPVAQGRVRKPWWQAVPAKRMLAPNLDDQEGLGKGLSRTVPQVRHAKTRSATAASPALRGLSGERVRSWVQDGCFLAPTRLKSNDHSALSQPDLLLAAANASGVY